MTTVAANGETVASPASREAGSREMHVLRELMQHHSAEAAHWLHEAGRAHDQRDIHESAYMETHLRHERWAMALAKVLSEPLASTIGNSQSATGIPPDTRVHLSLHDVRALAEFIAAETQSHAIDIEQAESQQEMIDHLDCISECARWLNGLRTLAEDMEAAAGKRGAA